MQERGMNQKRPSQSNSTSAKKFGVWGWVVELWGWFWGVQANKKKKEKVGGGGGRM